MMGRKRFTLAGVMILLFCVGCGKENAPVLLQEGVILTVQWTDGAGETHGLSRLDIPQSVPGGNGSWNMDLYGRLYSTHLEIINQQRPNAEPEIVPFHRLDSIQFGMGGRTFEKN